MSKRGRTVSCCNLSKAEQGTSIIEFAICLPIIVILLAGTLELGRMLNSYLTINRVAYESVRYASSQAQLECGLYKTETDAPELHQLVRDRANLLLRRNGLDEAQGEQLITELKFVNNSAFTSDARFLNQELQVRVSLGIPFQPIFGRGFGSFAYVDLLRTQTTGAYLYDVPGGAIVDCG